MTTIDYAIVYELDVRPWRRRRARRVLARVLLGGLYLIRPKVAAEIWRERRG
ncbi:MAG TPA: hypothetical protein VHV27_03860 [Phenylobacterium sp.]|jgi:hypothetical protein|nr:hypothetical protein [Phenylobacterium sp.]